MIKIVARFVDGRILKGFTNDFTPGKDQFHMTPDGAAAGSVPVTVKREELKAVFFVKDFKGNPDHKEKKEFDPSRPAAGRKIKVVFKDGEMLIGTTLGYQRGRPGFFLESVDSESNMGRCYVVTSATREIAFV
jgi:hypothetical protein